jgi:hypothetical protein
MSECECVICNSFKAININTEKIVKKIAEMLGLSSIKMIDEGYFSIDDIVEIRCEREDFSWSDYCIRCFVVA